MTSGSNSFISRTQSADGGVSGCMPRMKREPSIGCVAVSCCIVAGASVVVGVGVAVEPIAAGGNIVEGPLAQCLATK